MCLVAPQHSFKRVKPLLEKIFPTFSVVISCNFPDMGNTSGISSSLLSFVKSRFRDKTVTSIHVPHYQVSEAIIKDTSFYINPVITTYFGFYIAGIAGKAFHKCYLESYNLDESNEKTITSCCNVLRPSAKFDNSGNFVIREKRFYREFLYPTCLIENRDYCEKIAKRVGEDPLNVFSDFCLSRKKLKTITGLLMYISDPTLLVISVYLVIEEIFQSSYFAALLYAFLKIVVFHVAFYVSRISYKVTDCLFSDLLTKFVVDLFELFSQINQILNSVFSYILNSAFQNIQGRSLYRTKNKVLEENKGQEKFSEEDKHDKNDDLFFRFRLYSLPVSLKLGDQFFVCRQDAAPELKVGRIGEIIAIDNQRLTIWFPEPALFCENYNHTLFKHSSDYFLPLATYRILTR